MDAEPTAPARRTKVLTPPQAIDLLPATIPLLAIGGMHLHNMPMALVRELARCRADFRIETLIGAGLVRRALVSYIGFEHLGLAPAFRRAAEAGTLAVDDVDAFSLLEAIRAGGSGLPFAALPGALARTDLPARNPAFYRPMVDPFTGAAVFAAPPLRPTVALIHCQEADAYGNGIARGAPFADRLLALAADTVILQVERLVEPAHVLRAPQSVLIPGFLVAAVVPVSFGAHPTSSHRYYNYDEVHLHQYLQQAATPDGFAAYLATYVDGPGGVPERYMDAVQDAGWE